MQCDSTAWLPPGRVPVWTPAHGSALHTRRESKSNHALAAQVPRSAVTMQEMISELHMGNRRRWELICLQCIISLVFFPEKKTPKQILAKVLWTWFFVLALSPHGWRSCKKSVGHPWVMDLQRPGKVACHAVRPTQTAHTQISCYGNRGVGGVTIPGSYGLLINIITANVRLQSHQNFRKTVFFLFCLTKHLKKKDCHLKIFFAFSCKWKHLLKSSSMKILT